MRYARAVTVTELAPGRRERKKAATRRALRDAAIRLAASRGFAAITVEDIAEAADVAPRTFFNYFASKEAAVLADMRQIQDEMVEELTARPAQESPLAALTAVLVGWARGLTADPDEWVARLQLIRADPHLRVASLGAWEELQAALSDVVARRTGVDAERDLYPTLVVSAALAAQRAALLRWQHPAEHRPLAELTAGALSALAGGLPAPAGPGGRRPRS